jgi:late competence protein required for DNA uptake (superfamily II DNA/RNA helicase)
LEKGNTLLFVPDTEDITEEQKKLLKDICYVIFNASNAGTSEGISKGTRDGTLLIATNISETGFTFFNIKRVISIG